MNKSYDPRVSTAFGVLADLALHWRGAHPEPHPLAGRQVRLDSEPGERMILATVEDWADRVIGKWPVQYGNPAVLIYAARMVMHDLPVNHEVLYVKHRDLAYLVHASEIASVVPVHPEVASPN